MGVGCDEGQSLPVQTPVTSRVGDGATSEARHSGRDVAQH